MDNDLFESCVDNYSDTAFRIALNYLKNASDAQDAVQNTFVRLLTCKVNFKSEAHIKHYIIRIAINESKRIISNPLYGKTDDLEQYANTLFCSSNEREIFYAAMALPKKYRIVIYLYYYEGYSTEEIAKIISKTPSAVRTQLRRAREKLKFILEDESNEK